MFHDKELASLDQHVSVSTSIYIIVDEFMRNQNVLGIAKYESKNSYFGLVVHRGVKPPYCVEPSKGSLGLWSYSRR
jgi:hypothetical protein